MGKNEAGVANFSRSFAMRYEGFAETVVPKCCARPHPPPQSPAISGLLGSGGDFSQDPPTQGILKPQASKWESRARRIGNGHGYPPYKLRSTFTF